MWSDFVLRIGQKPVAPRTLWASIIAICAIVCLFVALLAHAYVGSFSRYMADDYCTSSILRSKGLIAAQKYWYMSWSGRYSFTLAVSTVELIGPRAVPLLPATALASWLAALAWAIRRWSWVLTGVQAAVVAPLLAALVIFSTLDGTLSVAESLYWQTGMLTYLAPLILATLYAGLVGYSLKGNSGGRARIPVLAAGATLTFIAGCFSEVYASSQAGALLLAITASWMWAPRSCKRTALSLTACGFVGSALAIAVIVLAPGNAIRQAYFPPPPDLLTILTLSVFYALRGLAGFVIKSPFTPVLSLVLPAVLAFGLQPQAPEWAVDPALGRRELAGLFVLSAVAGFILIVLCFAPGVYSMSTTLPPRARLIPAFVTVCVTVYWGYLAGVALRQTDQRAAKDSVLRGALASLVVVALLVLSPIASARRTLALAPRAREYASTLDRRDQEILDARQRGWTRLAVPLIYNPEGLAEIASDPNHWVNRCVAGYYGLDTIVASPAVDEVVPF